MAGTSLQGAVGPGIQGMAGPTPWCNWVIKEQVLAGGYPASMDDDENARILMTLMKLGVDCFVCLQSEVNFDCHEHDWKSGR